MEAATQGVRGIAEYPNTPQTIAKYFETVYPERIVFTERAYRSMDECTTKSEILWEAFYHIALSDPGAELNYLKKSVAINPNFRDGWIDLSRVMIEKGNFALAKKYLENAYYIDGSDFRYYYYQSLLIKKTEEMNRLEKNNY